jgi:DNA-binding NtrC family response regulator
VSQFQIHKANLPYRQYLVPECDVLVIGRNPTCDISLADDTRKVSRYHAALVRLAEEGEYFIRDLGSLHGTRVNGLPVHQQILHDGDVVEIADYRLAYSTHSYPKSQSNRIRVVSRKGNALGRETSTLTLKLSAISAAAQFTGEKRELLEQIQKNVQRELPLADYASELMKGILRVLHADRGFIGIFRQGGPDTYQELGATGLAEGEEIEISVPSFMEELLAGNVLQETDTVLVPIARRRVVSGFFCVNRRSSTRGFPTDDVDFVGHVAKIVVTPNESATKTGSAKAEPVLEWPIEIVGKSEVITSLRGEIQKAASTDTNVLILGESGSGKELVARAVHQQSHRSDTFIARNCAQTTDTLAEPEIFGSAPKSGISGADAQGAPGWFEKADGGTLFLDEVHGLSLAMQDKFLRVLQDKEVWRFGAKHPVQVNVKVIAATDKDVERMVEEGSLRQPFYFRFGMKIHVPPLRDRREDIPLLVYYFLDKYAKARGSRARTISHRALKQLMNHDWPGNVRQLEQLIKTAVEQDHDAVFSWDFEDQLQTALRVPVAPRGRPTSDSDSGEAEAQTKARVLNMEDVEQEKIKEALEVTLGNVTKAAELLGYKSRQTILTKMDKYGIPRNYADPQMPGSNV